MNPESARIYQVVFMMNFMECERRVWDISNWLWSHSQQWLL